MLEKLSSDVLSAKLDSLQTLVSVVPICEVSALETYREPLWNTVKMEVHSYYDVNVVLKLCCHSDMFLMLPRCSNL